MSVVDILEGAVRVVEFEESKRRSERDGCREMEREISLPALLPALKDGRERSEDLTDSILSLKRQRKGEREVRDCSRVYQDREREKDEPSSVTSSGKLNGERMVASVVPDHRDPPEAESIASTKLDRRREPSDLGELAVAVDVL